MVSQMLTMSDYLMMIISVRDGTLHHVTELYLPSHMMMRWTLIAVLSHSAHAPHSFLKVCTWWTN